MKMLKKMNISICVILALMLAVIYFPVYIKSFSMIKASNASFVLTGFLLDILTFVLCALTALGMSLSKRWAEDLYFLTAGVIVSNFSNLDLSRENKGNYLVNDHIVFAVLLIYIILTVITFIYYWRIEYLIKKTFKVKIMFFLFGLLIYTIIEVLGYYLVPEDTNKRLLCMLVLSLGLVLYSAFNLFRMKL
jgi:hypothetical protein